jgi:hypothetical protein
MQWYENGPFLNLRFPWRKRTLGKLNQYSFGFNQQPKLFKCIKNSKTNKLIRSIILLTNNGLTSLSFSKLTIRLEVEFEFEYGISPLITWVQYILSLKSTQFSVIWVFWSQSEIILINLKYYLDYILTIIFLY